jgi:hypothetical protein
VYSYVCSGHSRLKVIVVCACGTATEYVLKRLFSVTRYEKLPELSLDAFHASEMVVLVVAVMRRFVGTVGGVRSRRAAAAPAVLAPKATMSKVAPMASPVVRKDIRSSLPRGSHYASWNPVRRMRTTGFADGRRDTADTRPP